MSALLCKTAAFLTLGAPRLVAVVPCRMLLEFGMH
jgi:hypothetical protein